MKYEANLVVIGAGSAGLVSAYIAAAVKAKVILIERHKMGGDCLNYGCVPSKALLRSAKVAAMMRRAPDYGLQQVDVVPDFQKVMQRVQEVIQQVAPHDSVERYTELGVECVMGEAELVNAHTVRVNGRTITTKSIILAAGARPFVPPIPGLDKVEYFTSDSVWDLQELPKRLVVLGGGPIGCELSQAFQELGAEVTIVEMLPQLMGREDADVARLIENDFKQQGIQVLTNHKAVKVSNDSGKKTVHCQDAIDGKSFEVEFDALLVAVGRKSNADKLRNLDELGIKLRKNGTIETDAYLRTGCKNVYACGDITGPYQFTHAAAHQAWYATVNALFSPFRRFKADYSVIPWATFTSPEVARVGINESEADERMLDYQVTKYDLHDLDRAICDGETKGFVKVITKGKSDKILGATIVAAHASDLIAEWVLAMKSDIGLNKILGTIHLYPSNAEANKYAAGVWKKNNKPEGLLKWVAKFHAWRRS